MLNDAVIDLSHWNDVQDGEKAKQSGVMGVIYKCTEGASYIDDTYLIAKDGCEKLGLLFGGYHFLRPGDMAQQAAHFFRTAGNIDLYVADHEDRDVSLEDLKEFLWELERLTGNPAVIYSGFLIKEQLPDDVHDEELARHRLWLAQYTKGTPTWPKATWKNWWLWQHTDEGQVPGINGHVDLNNYIGDEKQLVADWTGQEDDSGEVVVRVIVPSGVKVVIEEE